MGREKERSAKVREVRKASGMEGEGCRKGWNAENDGGENGRIGTGFTREFRRFL